jgi:excinuclease UvrABC nuclease subunit
VERIINETYLLKPEGEWVHQIRFVAKKNTTLLPEEKEEELFQFFQGKVDHLLARLKLNMEYASQEWQFKWAGQYLEDQKTIDEFMQLNKHLLEFAQITGKYFKVEEGNQVRYLLLENGLVAEIAASFEHFKPQQTTKLTGISKADLDEMMILSSFLKNHPEITLETL